MSTKEMLFQAIDEMTEEQIEGLYTFLMNFCLSDSDRAIFEIEDMKRNPDKYKGYNDVDEMMKELLS